MQMQCVATPKSEFFPVALVWPKYSDVKNAGRMQCVLVLGVQSLVSLSSKVCSRRESAESDTYGIPRKSAFPSHFSLTAPASFLPTS
jgi:hypothetical protein